MQYQNKKAIVVGAGIAGLACAYQLARKNFEVTVVEKNGRATGASVRNFGMIWPIGQPAGKLYQRAINSRNIWKELSEKKVCWHEQKGSLHVAHRPEEWNVLQELYEIYHRERPVELLNAKRVSEISPACNTNNLLGGLFSNDELIVDPREAIRQLPVFLQEQYHVKFNWDSSVSEVKQGKVVLSNRTVLQADIIVVCTGALLQDLFEEFYKSISITLCKLQMMRLAVQPAGWRIGPALCGGLSLIHYRSFQAAKSLQNLLTCYKKLFPEYLQYGIHVMVSQHHQGELTVGDSHEYGLTPDPFDCNYINELILSYFKTFASVKSYSINETWHGIYAKMTDGQTELFHSPAEGVYLLNGLGGAGMTLSFGLTQELFASF